jgi:three-Cys-motif partner protein
MGNVKPIDLRGVPNPDCIGTCNKEQRETNTENDLCKITKSVLDGLPLRCVGQHAERKIYHLIQYFGIFAQGMQYIWKNKMNYIEICSGPGRCIFRETKEEVNGTALSILLHEKFEIFSRALFVDYNLDVVNALNSRIKLLGKNSKATATQGDYTDIKQMEQLLNTLPKECLNLVFIDPTDCSLPFETIKTINRILNRVDFIINLALFYDAARHLRNVFVNPDRFQKGALPKYSKFLGNMNFFNNPKYIELAEKNGTEENLRAAFINEYCESFKRLGYTFIDTAIRVNGYYLFFASKSERALDFWKRIQVRDEHGQTSFLAMLN